jgi:hypothetical protein
MDKTPEEASAEAIHKAKGAAQAIETARELQLAKAVEETATRTKDALLEGLREVFGNEDTSQDPQKMKILVHRIPIICRDVLEIKDSVAATNKSVDKINDNLSRVVWIVLTAVILAILGMIFVK